MQAMIRPLDPEADLAAVAGFYRAAPDYWLLAEGACEPDGKAAGFFADGPPGCDPADSDRLGLFLDRRLSGVAEVSYGFPARGDAYLGLMMLGPWAQGAGHGRMFLAHAVARARGRGAPMLYLAARGVHRYRGKRGGPADQALPPPPCAAALTSGPVARRVPPAGVFGKAQAGRAACRGWGVLPLAS